ncbi:MAG: phage tail sheath family protein [Pseudobutyrivibrio sp.]|uniref:phage tail sheath subtilisin-like domain-containing protein n=1 Tax=Pseudobutyrivibrio sp. TaxID=2014367 RepID=UPI001B0894AE|nr:phage tail sheath subtilisin-like domain-containing protein [Pseudobutyrivibrio sp.]MBO6283518.1 phage tail sheath family protein [Pseudobutyrivibrio sp.]MBP3261181.1 phage tail sheath family protein [Pseudobutyrivibrio sp.]
MAEYLSPGVYVEEIDNGPRSIEGVGTSTAGFIGMAEKGPIEGAPELVTTFNSFLRIYGGFLSEFTHGEYRFLAHAVEQFFTNGGTRCYVMRVAPEDAKPASKKQGFITATAVNPGKWGNKVIVTLSQATKRKLQLMGKISDTTYLAKNAEGIREGDIVVFEKEYNMVTSVFDREITFANPFKADVVDAELLPKKVLYLVETDMTIKYQDQIENYPGINFTEGSPDYVVDRAERSEIATIAVGALPKSVNPVAELFEKDATSLSFNLDGGSDGSISKVNAGTFIGIDKGPGQRTGIQSFLENSTVSMMAIPGVTTPEVQVALVAHCENLGSRFAVLDMPQKLSKPKDLIEFRGLIDSTYAAMYHPWVQVFDRSANKSSYIPPSGSVLGVYSRTDINRGVHKAPANETVACTGLSINYTKAEQDILNPEGVNLIRALPGQGIRIWGARTASSSSSFRYINVRRLFIFVEESIKASTNWVVFEPNDSMLWSRVSITVASFLDNLWRAGMLAGDSASEAYFVEIGTNTMSRDDIENGRLICNIGIAPTKPAEFVIFRISQFTAEAGGGEE